MSTRALSTAATGMQSMSTAIDVISNNLSNISTTGHKRERAEFSDLLYQKEARAGIVSDSAGNIIPAGINVGLGSKVIGIYRIYEQGPLSQTFNTYDIAIRDNGFFRIEMPDGSYSYTRAGSFRLSANSELVTDKGLVVTPGIIIPPNVIADSVTINQDGQVSVKVQGNILPEIVGQIDLVDFPNPVGLDAIGDNLLIETAASGAPVVGVANTDGMGSLIQGWLENSNVNPVTELTELIKAQRGYELCSKAIIASDEMMQTVNRLKQ
ncbi:MAG: flagellar basal-body rod protein FlgG [Rickettsiales bacterium]|nr:MAG: flagellar basal-body rod protein FlgG [Rickettsiales bacterium]